MLKLKIKTSLVDTTSLLKKIATLYNIDSVSKCSLIKHSNNDIYILTSSEYNFIIKIYSKEYKKEKINFFIDSLLKLSKESDLISYPIRRLDGKYISTIALPEGNRFLIITSYAKGQEQKYQYKKDSFRYGKFVAKLHKLSDIVIPNTINSNEFNISIMLKDSMIIIKEFLLLKKQNVELLFLDKFVTKLNQKINSINFNEFNQGFCHGDLHGGNAHLLNEKLQFFDFDYCGFGLRAYDIAVFRWSTIIGKRENHWNAFLKGYQSIYNLTQKDLDLINYFVAIRDISVMAKDIEKTKYLGEEYINIFYVKKRISFLKEIENFF